MHHVRGHTQWSGDQLHVQKESGYEDLTRENFRHFDSYGFSNLVILQRDKEISITEVCRKVARK